MGAVGAKPAAAAGGFSPLSIGWFAAFYADDITGLSDGDPVATWSDSTGNGRSATQATSSRRPVYRPTAAALNGQPAVVPDGVDDYLETATFASSQAQPNTIVIVADMPTTANQGLCDGNAARHHLFVNTGNILLFAGSSSTATAATTGAHLFVAEFNGASSSLTRDGVVSTASPGSQGLDLLRLFAHRTLSSLFAGATGFVGLHAGSLTSTEKADLLAWSQSKYGTP